MQSYSPSGRCSWKFWILFAASAAGILTCAEFYQGAVTVAMGGMLPALDEPFAWRRKGRGAAMLLLFYPGLIALSAWVCVKFGHCRNRLIASGLFSALVLTAIALTHRESYHYFELMAGSDKRNKSLEMLEQLEQRRLAIDPAEAKIDAAWTALTKAIAEGEGEAFAPMKHWLAELDGKPSNKEFGRLEALAKDNDALSTPLVIYGYERASLREAIARYRAEYAAWEEHEAIVIDTSFAGYRQSKAQGWPTIDGWGVGGAWIWFTWIFEVFLLLACGPTLAWVFVHRPYCETCGKWAERDRLWWKREDQDAAGLTALGAAESIEALIDLPPAEKPDGKTVVWYRIARCKSCEGTRYLSIASGSVKTAKKDMDDLSEIHEYLVMDEAQFAHLKQAAIGWKRSEIGPD